MVIPNFTKISAVARDRITRCFKERDFIAGKKLISEGAHLTSLFVIMEGEVLLSSTKSPLDTEIGQNGQIKNMGTQKMISNKGYMSKTINTF